jgi:hypothetical protein
MNHNKCIAAGRADGKRFGAACGGSDTTSTATPAPVAQSGVFLDAAVEGLDYTSGTAKGTTQADGGFSCNSGDSMSFSVGSISLGSAPCAAVITPLSLANQSNSNDDKVVNRLMALQLLDEDNDPSNGIRLSSTVKTALAGQALDFNANAATFNTAMTNLLSKLPATYQSRSADADRRALVREHFEDTLASKMESLSLMRSRKPMHSARWWRM